VRRPRMSGQLLDHALAERYATMAQAALGQVFETHLGQHLAPAGVETLSSCRGTQGSLLWRRGIQELTRLSRSFNAAVIAPGRSQGRAVAPAIRLGARRIGRRTAANPKSAGNVTEPHAILKIDVSR